MRSGGNEKDFGLDRIRRRAFRIILPEHGRLGFKPIGHHQPLQFAQALAVQSALGPPAAGFWPKTKYPFTSPLAMRSKNGSCE